MRDGSVEMIVEVKRKKNNGAVWLTSIWTTLGMERQSLWRRIDYRS